MEILEDKTKLKQIFKEAVEEVLEDKKDLFYDLFQEIIEDIAMERAIMEGRDSENVDKSEILKILEGQS